MQTYPFRSGGKGRFTKFYKIIVFVHAIAVSAQAQNLERAKRNLAVLSSKNFAGRGYLENGHLKAAGFLKSCFKNLGLKPIQKSYFQHFTIDQNIFPEDPELLINSRILQVGVDYLPAPDCPSLSGKFKIKRLDSVPVFDPGKNEKNMAWILEKKAFKEWQKSDNKKFGIPELLIGEDEKLTHTLSLDASKTARLIIKKGVISESDSLLQISIKSTQQKKIKTRNVLGMVKGTTRPDSFLVVCAHYDHLGKIGKSTIFPGANDNASGITMLLELADHFSKNPLPYSLVFIAFSAEEAGLLGSFHFVENPLIPLDKIRFLLNLDLLGYGDKGATVVNATIHEPEFRLLTKLNEMNKYLPEIKPRGKAANSDHFPFSEKGVPAFFLYSLGGPGHYHDVFDKAETVTFSGFQNTYTLILNFLKALRP